MLAWTEAENCREVGGSAAGMCYALDRVEPVCVGAGMRDEMRPTGAESRYDSV